MKSVLVPLYWVWVGFSVFYLVKRRLSKSKVGPSVSSTDAPAASLDAEATNGSFPPPPPLPPPPGAEAAAAATPEPASAPPPPPPPSPPPSPLLPPPPATGPSTSTAVVDAATAVALGVPLSTVDSLADALEGISLPCGLAPLTGTGEFDPKALVLFTAEDPASAVGTAMTAELERLGFSCSRLHDQATLARTEGAAVEVTVHHDAEAEDDLGRRLFPTAPSGTVVVELHLR